MKIAIAGAAGRMGQMLIQEISRTEGCKLAAALEGPGSKALGTDAGGGVKIVSDAAAAIGAANAIIDFTVPAATVAHARIAADKGVAMVIGTTGLSPGDREELAASARQIPIVFTPNMSVGVNMLLKLVADAARVLGPGYDLEIVETHHRAKRDAPSGTALRLAQALAEATGRDLAATARYDRHGEIGARSDEEIGIQTVRGGDVVGDHTVHFLGVGERIEITHRATSRDTFAHGAVRAALWLAGGGSNGTGQRRGPGLYDMRDVLDL